jgi:predicted DNA-binding transcriptional regulator AlpA
MSISLQETNYAEKYAQLAKKYLNPKELEEIYGFSRSWQSKKRMLCSIPYIKVGGHIRYSVEAINKWLEDHQIK